MTAFVFYESVAPFKEKQRISNLETEHYQGIMLANELQSGHNKLSFIVAFFTQNTVLKRPFKLVKFVKTRISKRYEPKEVKNFDLEYLQGDLQYDKLLNCYVLNDNIVVLVTIYIVLFLDENLN